MTFASCLDWKWIRTNLARSVVLTVSGLLRSPRTLVNKSWKYRKISFHLDITEQRDTLRARRRGFVKNAGWVDECEGYVEEIEALLERFVSMWQA